MTKIETARGCPSCGAKPTAEEDAKTATTVSSQSDAHARANVECINECHEILDEAGFDESRNDGLRVRILDVTQQYCALFIRASDLLTENTKLIECVRELRAHIALQDSLMKSRGDEDD